MELPYRDVCDEVKAATQALEEGMIHLLAEKGEQAIGRTQFKKFTFDFYKENGGMHKVQLHTPHSKGKKKDKRHFINTILLGIGEATSIDFEIEEEKSSYKHSVILSSGEALVICSDVKNIKLGVEQVVQGSKPKGLVLRNGSLVLMIERD